MLCLLAICTRELSFCNNSSTNFVLNAANAEIAMEPSKAVKEYKEELVKSQKQNERLTALVGKVTVEKEWLAKKLKSLYIWFVFYSFFLLRFFCLV
jgi:hypothetical protein